MLKVLLIGAPHQEFMTIRRALLRLNLDCQVSRADNTISEDELRAYDVLHFWQRPSMSIKLRNVRQRKITYDHFGFPFGDEEVWDVVIHVSKSCFARCARRLRIDPSLLWGRHIVSYLPVDTDLFSPLRFRQEEIMELREELGVGPNEVLLGRSGRPDIFKWDFFSVNLLAKLRIMDIKAKMLVIGGIPEIIKREITKKRLWEHFIEVPYTAEREEVARYLASIDIYVHSAFIGESLGRAIMEAMAMEKPVIVSYKPWADNAPTEYIENFKCGLLCTSVEEASRFVAYLIKNPRIAKKIGINARRKVVDLCDSKLVAKNLFAIYRGSVQAEESIVPSKEDVISWCRVEYPRTHSEKIGVHRILYLTCLNMRKNRLALALPSLQRVITSFNSLDLSLLP